MYQKCSKQGFFGMGNMGGWNNKKGGWKMKQETKQQQNENEKKKQQSGIPVLLFISLHL